MAEYRRTNAPTSGDTKSPMGRVNRYTGMYIGVVKNNDDAQTMGRLQVWVPEFGSDENDTAGWRTVSYCSPFAGATPLNNVGQDVSDFNQTQTSYGMWFAPPDLENQVIIFFANGDPVKGFWVGCVYQQNMNSMIPNVSASTDYEATGLPSKYHSIALPTAEYNKRTTAKVSNTIKKPIAMPYFKGVSSQGLIKDRVRGVATASVKSSSPSAVYGILTPGPINPDSPNKLGRLGGHQLTMDDTDGNENITLKTRSGAQLRIDETNGIVYFINTKGTGWLQIDEEGNGEWFLAKSLSMRAQEDFNIRADRDVNIEAGRNVNIKARKDHIGDTGNGIGGEAAGSGGQINFRALDVFTVKAETDMLVETVSGQLNLNVSTDVRIGAGGTLFLESGADTNIKAGANINNESGGDTSVTAAAINMEASAGVGIAGLSVDIDGGTAFSADASAINLNSGAAAPGAPTAAEAAAPGNPVDITENAKTNVLYNFEDDAYKFDRKTEDLSSITSRLATFEPCPDHKNKGET